jgi:hypothetical protein
VVPLINSVQAAGLSLKPLQKPGAKGSQVAPTASSTDNSSLASPKTFAARNSMRNMGELDTAVTGKECDKK